MSTPAPEPIVKHAAAANRFEVVIDGHPAVAEYVREGTIVTMTHTFVPPELRGRGLAEKLVVAALAWARAEGLRVVPACSYVAKFLERHPEYGDLAAR
jgi:predicted GNAT family acetyltransferase